MAKKHQWKKAIRAEVAAALQNQNRAGAAPHAHPGTPQQRTNAVSTRSNPAPAALPIDPIVSRDLWRIFWVALILVALLASATVTDRRNHWLDGVAKSLTDQLSKLATH